MRCLLALVAIAAAPALADTIKITASRDAFKPETVTAERGDILEFRFGAGNHSVAMGEFDSVNGPCVPANEGGFFSGYFAVKSGESDKVFRVTVNNTDPAVFYSTQGDECAKGLIGGVNIKDKAQMQKYREDARDMSASVAPREVFGGVVVAAGSKADDDNDGDDDDGDENGTGPSARVGLVGVVSLAGLAAMLV